MPAARCAAPQPTPRCAVCRGTLEEVDSLLSKARMFQNKPEGEVTLRFKQDKQGVPVPLQQDPIHYPFGTGFLMPGPAGQCLPIPGAPPPPQQQPQPPQQQPQPPQ